MEGKIIPVGGKIISNYGLVSINININQYDIITKKSLDFIIIILDSVGQYDIIFGMPALESLDMQVNFKLGIVHAMGQKLKLIRNAYKECIEVRTEKDEIIPAGTAKLVKVHPNSNHKLDGNTIYAIYPSNTLNNTKILQLANIGYATNINYLYICNRSPKNIKINKGALVAYMSPKNENFFMIGMTDTNYLDTLTEEQIIEEEMFIPGNQKRNIIEDQDIKDRINGELSEEEKVIFNIIHVIKHIFTNSMNPGVNTKCHVTLID